MMSERQEFGILLNKLIRRNGKTQKFLAEEIGYGESAVSRMLTHSIGLTGDGGRKKVIKIIKVFQDIDPDFSSDEANRLLLTAGMGPLKQYDPIEVKILEGFSQTEPDDTGDLSPSEMTPSVTINYAPASGRLNNIRQWLILVSLLVIIVIGLVFTYSYFNRQEADVDICSLENVTCLGAGWCKVDSLEVRESDGKKVLAFGDEADLNKDHYVYFNEEHILKGDLDYRQYDDRSNEWSFVISDSWADSHPGWSEKGNWFLTVECQ